MSGVMILLSVAAWLALLAAVVLGRRWQTCALLATVNVLLLAALGMCWPK